MRWQNFTHCTFNNITLLHKREGVILKNKKNKKFKSEMCLQGPEPFCRDFKCVPQMDNCSEKTFSLTLKQNQIISHTFMSPPWAVAKISADGFILFLFGLQETSETDVWTSSPSPQSASSCGCQSCLPVIGHQHEPSELHNSTSHNRSKCEIWFLQE